MPIIGELKYKGYLISVENIERQKDGPHEILLHTQEIANKTTDALQLEINLTDGFTNFSLEKLQSSNKLTTHLTIPQKLLHRMVRKETRLEIAVTIGSLDELRFSIPYHQTPEGSFLSKKPELQHRSLFYHFITRPYVLLFSIFGIFLFLTLWSATSAIYTVRDIFGQIAAISLIIGIMMKVFLDRRSPEIVQNESHAV